MNTNTHRKLSWVAFVCGITFLALLALLHPVKDELSPSWRMISEYEIGHHGWLMSLAFVFLAAGSAALAAAVRPYAATRAGRVGVAILVVAAAGMVLAALGTSDPITASSDELTTHGKVHGFGAMLGIPGVPIAAALISRSLRRSASWRRSTVWVSRMAIATWGALAVFAASLAVMYEDEFGPDVKIGWPNRLVIIADVAWLMTTALAVARACATDNQSSAAVLAGRDTVAL